jgi:hypothetical protein
MGSFSPNSMLLIHHDFEGGSLHIVTLVHVLALGPQ